MESKLGTDVLIVGAGPTGLSLAAQLIRYGIDFVIVDGKESVTNLSKALVVHARTLEIYDQLGLAKPAVDEGVITQNAVIIHDGKIRATLDFADVGGELSPFPFMLMFEQSKNEHLLYENLKSSGHEVRWQTELTDLTQDNDGVEATLKNANGENRQVRAHYLVGCDGAKSATRHHLDLGFTGATDARIFFVADVDLEFDGRHDSVYASFESNGFLLLFPIRGENRWRLIGRLPEYETAESEQAADISAIAFDEIADKIKETMKYPFSIQKTNWFSTYKVHTRRAETFSKGRCFLAGDAAHIHTPAGGQGMNTGIQDAYNLAWKLAMVLKNRADDTLLETYSAERVANAKRLLETTDRFFNVAAGDSLQQRFLRDNILPPLAGFAWRFDAFKEVLFPSISQIGIHYPDSLLSRHDSDKEFKVKAGDRMPYFRVDGTNIYDRLNMPTFHLLHITDDESGSMEKRTEMESAFGELVDIHVLPLLPQIVEQFGVKHDFWILLRPDNYIGSISTTLSVSDLRLYFDRFGA